VRRPSPKQVAENVGRRLAELRRKRGETQAQLAEGLGFSVKYMQRLERGANMTIDSLVTIANHLDVDVRDLFKISRARPAPRRPGRPKVAGKKTRPRR
jgi:transcriptional regulator with XRE-family HTH domain